MVSAKSTPPPGLGPVHDPSPQGKLADSPVGDHPSAFQEFPHNLPNPLRVPPMMLALRLARRELRGGVRGLRIVVACLALGVAVIGAVGTLRVATERGLQADGRRLLGGDLEVDSGSQPLPEAARDWLIERGAHLSGIIELRTLLVAPSGERTLVELKAVDAAWPLVGTVTTDPPLPVTRALAEQEGQFGLLTSQVVLDRLGLHPGDTARLGSASFTIHGGIGGRAGRARDAGAIRPACC